MAVVDLSNQGRIVMRQGRFFRERQVLRGRGFKSRFEELSPSNGRLTIGDDGFVYFAGDPFPPCGAGRYRVGEFDLPDKVHLYPGVVLDTLGDGQRRFRISYRYLTTYRQTAV